MSRVCFVGLWCVAVTAGGLTIATALVTAFTQSNEWGATAAVFGGTTLVTGWIAGLWSIDPPPPLDITWERPLPRAERRRIRQARARIATDRRIAELEREAGLR